MTAGRRDHGERAVRLGEPTGDPTTQPPPDTDVTTPEPPASTSFASLAPRIVRVLRHAENRSPRTERILLAVALIVFVGGSWLAWSNLPDVDTDPRWWLLIPASLMMVAALAINGGEFTVVTHLLGRRIPFLGAFHVSVLSSAANVLPIPGAVVVKTRALRQQGQGYRESLAITSAVGVMWVALAFVAAGVMQALAAEPGTAALFLGIGAVGVAFAFALLAAAVGRDRTLMASIPVIAIELLSVMATSVRIYLLILAMGFDAPFNQAVAITCAAIVASAVGIFPSGIGLREVLSAAMAGLVGLDPAIGLLVSAVDRILMFGVLGLASAAMLATGASQRALETTELDAATPPFEPQPLNPQRGAP